MRQNQAIKLIMKRKSADGIKQKIVLTETAGGEAARIVSTEEYWIVIMKKSMESKQYLR